MPVLDALTFLIGLALLVAGAGLMVRGASGLALALKVPPIIVGLTIVAYGTSAPELIVSLTASINGETDIAIGNVVGSNIFNVLGILGLSALVAPLVVSSRIVRVDVPLMIGASGLLIVMALDGTVGRLDGAILFTGLLLYTFWLWHSERRNSCPEGEASNGSPVEKGTRRLWFDLLLLAVGLALLIVGSQQTVLGATRIAGSLGISEVVIGLTVVSIGTSLPELATSVLAAFRGERDLAVGNVVGSNIFNILGVQGVASLASVTGVAVAPSVINQDMLIMLAVAIGSLPIFFTGYLIARWEGALFVGYMIAYLIYLFIQTEQRNVAGFFSFAMAAFVIPITVLTLVIVLVRELRARRISSTGK